MSRGSPAATAARFWRMSGGAPPFPRSIEEPILWALPLAVIRLPRLGLSAIRDYLSGVQISCPFAGADRPIRGCLVARRGEGLVFLDGTDPLDEQRFSLAHEVSHFLLDYHLPREDALKRMGPTIRPVLDGERLPVPSERVDAVLMGAVIQTYRHLMDRGRSGEVVHSRTLEAEDCADQLALELLAPRSAVVALVSKGRSAEATNAELRRILRITFGLPTAVAERYAPLFLEELRPPTSVRRWLGLRSR